MIANENQYQVTREWERDFAQLVEYMESAEADTTPRDSPVLRRAKLEAARSTLDELRQELRDWESRHTVDRTSQGIRHPRRKNYQPRNHRSN